MTVANQPLENTADGRNKCQKALDVFHACRMNQSNAALAMGLSRQAFQRRLAAAGRLGMTPKEVYNRLDPVNTLAEDNKRLRAQLAEAQKQIAAEAEIRSSVFKLAEVSARPPNWTTTVVKGRKAARQTPILFSSDQQFGEVVRPSEINGFNADDVKNADQRSDPAFTPCHASLSGR